jgi:hypothetical protein
MRFFYIFPFKIQYYFSSDFRKYSFILNFFTPYSFTGKIFWWIWRRFFFIKFFFRVDESKVPDLKALKTCTGNNKILAINKGTAGPEQKTTAICYFQESDKSYFLKYAKSEKAKSLVINEYSILLKLNEFPCVPQIINYQQSHTGISLLTGFIEGEKFCQTVLSDKIYNLLIRLSKVSIKDCPDYVESFTGRKCFGHGDFCPWNIMVSDNNLHLIDWEMGGAYPAGYDLFTFLFQTQFILHPDKKPEEIILYNLQYIKSYFLELGIELWESLLMEFARYKFEYNKEKSPALARKFSEILKINL